MKGRQNVSKKDNHFECQTKSEKNRQKLKMQTESKKKIQSVRKKDKK